MKTFILLILTSLTCAAAQIQIHARYDNHGSIVSYDVHTWNGPDQGMIVTKYTIAEAQGKFGNVLDKTQYGLSEDIGRLTLIYDEAGEIFSVTAQSLSVKTYDIGKDVNGNPVETNVSNTGKFYAKPTPKEDLSEQVKTDADSTKTDVEEKTEKDIGGGEVKP